MLLSFSRTFLIGTFAALAVLLLPAFVQAQEAGVRISPAVIEETLDPGKTVQYTFDVENLTDAEQLFYIFTRNISGVAEGGAPIFAESDLEVTGYELVDWLDIPVNQINLQAGGKESVNFTLNVPIDASPGSHFGGIFVSAEPPEIEESGAAVGYQVANIVSIRVSGEAIETASIRQFSTGKFLYGSQNVDFNVKIENAGNVLVRPAGPLTIKNSLGKKVGEVFFNESRSGVFPGKTREFDDVQWLGDSIGFGRYEAMLTPVYGDDGARKTMSSTVTFWVLPINIIGPAALVLGVLLLATVIAVKLYIRRTLAQMTTGRRLVRRRNQGSSTTLLLTVAVLTVLALFMLVMLVLFA